MAPRVLLQAGHAWCPNGGGAPGEATWTAALAEKLAVRLRAAGVEVAVVGAWLSGQTPLVPPPEVYRDWTLFLSLHYDAPVKRGDWWDDSGCFADRATRDPMGAEADRFIDIWEPLYSAGTGIGIDAYRGQGNPNTDDYYAFRSTPPRTPGVILEHGCGSPVAVGTYPAGGDSTFLHDNLDTVAALDTQAVLTFLGIDTVTDEEKRILDTMAALGANADSIIEWINRIGALEAVLTEGRRVVTVTVRYDDGTEEKLHATD